MPDLSRFHVAVIGGGPAGLMAAEVIAAAGARVTVYDRMPTLGRKFLMAGRGGLNLTHSEEFAPYLSRYGARAHALQHALDAFTPSDTRAWCEALGQPTFVGSSGRVFPKSMKASPLLRAWLRRLADHGVQFRMRHRWEGWDQLGQATFQTPDGAKHVEADATVLALGGASWPNLGSDGAWAKLLAQAGVSVVPLEPANCGFRVAWSDVFKGRFQGHPLKRIAMSYADQRVRGEALLTAEGIEGGAIYALSKPLREALARDGKATIHIDLRPDIEQEALCTQLETPRRKQSLSEFLRKAAQLLPPAIGLLQEHAHVFSRPLAALMPYELAARIKAVPVDLTATAPIARAISTAGGLAWDALDADLMLVNRPGTFAAGEMLDWEGPTGGYLLQACFSTGAAAGRGALGWLARQT